MQKQLMLLLLAIGLVSLPACITGSDPSVVVDDKFRPDSRVENGTAYDRAAVDLGTAKKIVLPNDATVRWTGEAGKVQLLMAKTLSFAGHPPKPVSIGEVRKKMGCAVRSDGDALVLATYGEWDSRIEGGTHMKLVAAVPKGVEVEQRKGLSGPESAGREWQGRNLTKPKDAQNGSDYGSASPADAWTAVPDVPDPSRAADE